MAAIVEGLHGRVFSVRRGVRERDLGGDAARVTAGARAAALASDRMEFEGGCASMSHAASGIGLILASCKCRMSSVVAPLPTLAQFSCLHAPERICM